VTKNFRHAPVEIDRVTIKAGKKPQKRTGDFIRVRKWFGRTGDSATCGSIKGIIQSIIVGVTEVRTFSSFPALVQRVCVFRLLSFCH
jgi:hypothetical protein